MSTCSTGADAPTPPHHDFSPAPLCLGLQCNRKPVDEGGDGLWRVRVTFQCGGNTGRFDEHVDADLFTAGNAAVNFLLAKIAGDGDKPEKQVFERALLTLRTRIETTAVTPVPSAWHDPAVANTVEKIVVRY